MHDVADAGQELLRSDWKRTEAKPARYVGDWPGLSPGELLRRPAARELPFPLSAPHRAYFFRARNAIYHLVRSLGIRDGQTVLVPDYHSGNEVWAIRAAGAALRYYHIGRDFRPDLEQVRRLCESTKPRALLAIHYLGWPQPIRALAELCAEHGITLIEDCALAMLSDVDGRPLGSFGHYGVFCLYKTVPIPNGGMLVQNGEPCEDLGNGELRPCSTMSLAGRTAELLVEWLRPRSPRLGGALLATKRAAGRRLSALGIARLPIGEIGFDPESVNVAISPLSLALLNGFDYAEIRRQRRENFLLLRQWLGGRTSVLDRELEDGVCPLFFPLLVKDKAAAARALRERGVAAVEFWNYGDPEAQGPGFADAQFLRAHLLELPIHQGVTRAQLRHVADQVLSLELHV